MQNVNPRSIKNVDRTPMLNAMHMCINPNLMISTCMITGCSGYSKYIPEETDVHHLHSLVVQDVELSASDAVSGNTGTGESSTLSREWIGWVGTVLGTVGTISS
jgi:hypothetical protein